MPTMRAEAVSGRPGGRDRLAAVERERPEPGADEVLVRVSASGVCRTDLHLADLGVRATVTPYRFDEADLALEDLAQGRPTDAAVLEVPGP